MKIRTFLVTCLAGASLLGPAHGENPDTAKESGLSPKIESLLLGLGDENFQVREQSSKELWAMGDKALPALREAIKSADPEQAIRAQDLIRKIQLHITPDTDESVITLVESYLTASKQKKATLLGQLRGKRAWRQMLKLYADESDPELRERLMPTMGTVAVRAARERLAQGDAAGAREFLEMAPATNANLLALADFHRSHGTLDQELEKARAGTGQQAAAWRLALLRAAGKPDAARDEALAAGNKDLAAMMSALTGDPIPYLRAMRDNNSDSPANSYASIASKRWQGEKIRKNHLEPLIRMTSSRDSMEQTGAFGALYLLGETDAVEPAFSKLHPLNAFQHYDALEQTDEALRALGIDPSKPDFNTWVKKRIEIILKADIGDQHEVSDDNEQVLALANFLERRGLHEAALAAYQNPLLEMAETNQGNFEEFIGRLFGGRDTLSGAPRLAKAIGRRWAGQDKERWEVLRTTALGDNERVNQWWDLLLEIDPKTDPAGILDAMLALGGIDRDTQGLRGKWLERIWENIAKTGPEQRVDLLEMLSEIASETGDSATNLRVWDALPPESRSKIFWGTQIIHLSAAERWNDAAEVVLKHIAIVTAGNNEPTADVHAYAAATLRAAGREKEAAAHDQSADRMALGNPMTSLRIGNGYAFGRDYQRAQEWWARAAIQVDTDTEEVAMAIKSHTDALLEQNRWMEAAATSEVLAAIYAGTEYQWPNQLPLMRQRLQADMCHALARLGTNRGKSLETLERCHRVFINDGSLADFFFPALRAAGLVKQHDEWFLNSWNRMEKVIAAYPQSDNTRNTAAWFAARAMRKLDEAEAHSRVALKLNPGQSAYLDTMAEIFFARGMRDKALEWSAKAVGSSPEDSLLRRQHARFLSEPVPK